MQAQSQMEQALECVVHKGLEESLTKCLEESVGKVLQETFDEVSSQAARILATKMKLPDSWARLTTPKLICEATSAWAPRLDPLPALVGSCGEQSPAKHVLEDGTALEVAEVSCSELATPPVRHRAEEGWGPCRGPALRPQCPDPEDCLLYTSPSPRDRG